MESGDWRAQLQDVPRNRIVNKITDTLKRHIPISGPEGLQELRKLALRFEQKIYTDATTTSQNDYLRKISLKMLTMEIRSQDPMPDVVHSNRVANTVNHLDAGMDHNNIGVVVDQAQGVNPYKRDPHFEIVGSMTRARTKTMNNALNPGAMDKST